MNLSSTYQHAQPSGHNPAQYYQDQTYRSQSLRRNSAQLGPLTGIGDRFPLYSCPELDIVRSIPTTATSAAVGYPGACPQQLLPLRPLSNSLVTNELSPGPSYRILPYQRLEESSRSERDRTFSRHLPPLGEGQDLNLNLYGRGYVPSVGSYSSPVHYLPPPLTAGVVQPGPYKAYQGYQDRYEHPHSSPIGYEEPRHHSLGSRQQQQQQQQQYQQSQGFAYDRVLQPLDQYSRQNAYPLPPISPSDHLRTRFPTPTFRYILPSDTPKSAVPSTELAFALIAQEEDRFRHERYLASRACEEFRYSPKLPIVYADNEALPQTSTSALTLDYRGREEAWQVHQPYYQSLSGEICEKPESSSMPARRTMANNGGRGKQGVITGSVRPSEARDSTSRRMNGSIVQTQHVADLPIVRSTRAKVYRKDMVTVQGRQHSVTVIEDESEEDRASRLGQKRKGDGTVTNGTKKRKVDNDVASSTTSRQMYPKAGTATSTGTQSTIATTVGSRAVDPVTSNQLRTIYQNNHYTSNGNYTNAAAPYYQPVIPASTRPVQAVAAKPVLNPDTGDANNPPPWDDKEGHYIIVAGNCMGENDKYKIMRLLGQGTFGKVVEAQAAHSFKKVAVKIIRAIPKYREASAIEIRVLKRLREMDPQNKYKCIQLIEYFDFRNHICLVTPLLGQSVFDFLKENSFQPFPEAHIQSFAFDILTSLSFVHSQNLIHTDLKPENILLVSNGYFIIGERVKGAHQKHILRNPDIRLIDFGSATFDNEFHSSVVSTRHYRAPEIILGLGWSFPCDMFSVGCILVEFFTGDALFQTHDNLEHLAMMEVVIGKMPSMMIRRAKAQKGEFFKGNQIDFPNAQTSKNSKSYVKKMKKLEDILRPNSDHSRAFLDLIKRLLAFDPAKRIDVQEALRHPYFQTQPPSAPVEPAQTQSRKR